MLDIKFKQNKLNKNGILYSFDKDANLIFNNKQKQKVILKNLYILKFLNQILKQNNFLLVFQYGSLSLVEKRELKKKIESFKMKISFFYPAQKEISQVMNILLNFHFNKNLFCFLESFRGNFFLIYGKHSNLVNINFVAEEFKAIIIKGVLNNVLYDQNNLLLYFKLLNQEKYRYLIEIYLLFFNFKLMLSLLSFIK